jgi:hypothetical protein
MDGCPARHSEGRAMRVLLAASVVAGIAGGSSVLYLAALGVEASTQTVADAGANYGFVITDLSPAFFKGAEKIDCPEGRSPTVKEAYLQTQSPAERLRLLKPENASELEEKYKVGYVFGAAGKDICTNSAEFDTPQRVLQHTVRSRTAYGLDLDGTNGSGSAHSCAHEKFESPTGEQDIDNQYYRAIGCNTFWRGAEEGVGDEIRIYQRRWADGPNTAVVILSGVHSWSNDSDVQITIASSPDAPPTDGSHHIIEGGSFSVTKNPRWRATGHAHIQNGALITDPMDVTLAMNWVGASGGEYILKAARFRLSLSPNGDLEGTGGAYRPIDNAVAISHVGGPGVASTAGVECASVRKTMRILADGDRDPATGQCKSISTGLRLAATPAFIFDDGSLVAKPAGRPVGAGGASR